MAHTFLILTMSVNTNCTIGPTTISDLLFNDKGEIKPATKMYRNTQPYAVDAISEDIEVISEKDIMALIEQDILPISQQDIDEDPESDVCDLNNTDLVHYLEQLVGIDAFNGDVMSSKDLPNKSTEHNMTCYEKMSDISKDDFDQFDDLLSVDLVNICLDDINGYMTPSPTLSVTTCESSSDNEDVSVEFKRNNVSPQKNGIKKRNGDRFRCKWCNKEYIRTDGARKHVLKHHRTEMNPKCKGPKFYCYVVYDDM